MLQQSLKGIASELEKTNVLSKNDLLTLKSIQFDIIQEPNYFVTHSYFDTINKIPHIVISQNIINDIEKVLSQGLYLTKCKPSDKSSLFNIGSVLLKNRYLFGNISTREFFCIDSSFAITHEERGNIIQFCYAVFPFLIIHEFSHILDRDYIRIKEIGHKLKSNPEEITIDELSDHREIEHKCDRFAIDLLSLYTKENYSAMYYSPLFNVLILNSDYDYLFTPNRYIKTIIERYIDILNYHRSKITNYINLDQMDILNVDLISQEIVSKQSMLYMADIIRSNNNWIDFPNINNKNIDIAIINSYIKQKGYTLEKDFDEIIDLYTDFTDTGADIVDGASYFTIGKIYEHFKKDNKMALFYYNKAKLLDFISVDIFELYSKKLTKV